MSDMNNAEVPIVIEPDQLSEQTLLAIIESFIQREGTDYGWDEISLESKIEKIRKQIAAQQIKIIFEQSTETVSLITAVEFRFLYSSIAHV